MSVTYFDVEQAISVLLEHKKPLTLANLRQALGDRGSMSTLTKYLQQWKAQRYIDSSKVAAPLSQPAPDSIFSAVQTVWQEMQGLGDRQVAEKQQALDLERQQWEAEKSALTRDLTQNKEALQGVTQDLIQVRNEQEELIAQYQHCTLQQQLLQQRLQDLQDFQLREKAIYEQTIDRLNAQNHTLTLLHQKALDEHLTALSAQKTLFEQALDQAQKQSLLEYQELLESYQQEQLKSALTAQHLQDLLGVDVHFQKLKEAFTEREQGLNLTLSEMMKELRVLSKQCERLKTLAPPYPPCDWTLPSKE